jgi:quinolinate synthase
MTREKAKQIIAKTKKDFGNKLVILGHHYQSDDIVEFSDYVGDSLELARLVTHLTQARIIIFCGVYFMAETAAILAPDKDVYIPDKEAGCPLADMANIEKVLKAWELINNFGQSVVPITYVNSTAEVKAFCGKYNGTVCTSGNAIEVFKWGLKNFGKIFFLPDRNLGKNTAYSVDIEDKFIFEWDFTKEYSETDLEKLREAKIILWKGYCPVHWPLFSVNDIKRLRSLYPDIKIVVHPECDPEVVKESDLACSTSKIITFANEQKGGAKLAIGTEYNLVNRLANKLKGKVDVIPLNTILCEDMGKITLEKLALILLDIDNSESVKVDKITSDNALISLENMLRI